MTTPLKATEACLDAAGTFGPVAGLVVGLLFFFLTAPWLAYLLGIYGDFVMDFMDRKSRERAARRAAKELQRQETRENP